jgi:hypothetical protein
MSELMPFVGVLVDIGGAVVLGASVGGTGRDHIDSGNHATTGG